MREEKVLINGINVNYKIAGEGPAILVLHGWGGSSDSWKDVIRILSAKRYMVVCPDFPGFGKSDLPTEAWGLEEYADFIFNLATQLGLKEVVLIGHSFGGRVSVKLIGKHPDLVKKLILCSSAGIKTHPGLKTSLIYVVSRIGNAILTPKFLRRFKNEARAFLYTLIKSRDYVKAGGIMKEIMKKVLAEDLTPGLSKIRVKTLLVWGEGDKLIPVKYARIFNEEINGSKLIVLPKIGHSPHLEMPEELSEIIDKFICS